MSALLWVEPVGGIAGDMFLAAAIDLGVPLAELEGALSLLGVPGFRLAATRAEAGGLAGTHLDVVVEGPQPHARGLVEILDIIARSGLSPRARAGATAVFQRIGGAEARVHGVPLERVHFHQVGAIDSIVDVCGAALVLDLLGWPRVHAVAPELGQGSVRTEHGRLPVPPPAVLEILKGFPVRPGGPPGEAVTPTGAALLATFCDAALPPPFTPRRIGIGVGTVRWPDRPNVLRLTLGELATGAAAGAASASTPAGAPPPTATATHAHPHTHTHTPVPRGSGADRSVPLPVSGGLVEIAANLDDCPGQLVARAIEVALEAGAVDAWAAPVTMKKGRPGVVLGALAPEERRDAVVRAIVAETTTLGVRFHAVERVELARGWDTVETPHGAVRVKVGWLDGEPVVAHPEYDDCAARAREHGVSVREVMSAAAAAWRSRPAGE
ncbi:MAG TPA: nickel pincer cofactor biosynthesis protein LarC [Anaeromyxobacteraceae bacterium]|nr:nickel pincer cofactor biosynthesis protein LarC [Anaeromyxobacteraceae bacterium]